MNKTELIEMKKIIIISHHIAFMAVANWKRIPNDIVLCEQENEERKNQNQFCLSQFCFRGKSCICRWFQFQNLQTRLAD
ncbi:hypothetical protein DERP_010274 [Dermatophagoides pteronyssinus]|uniref:Uncharacterized protein n=1 Tax=Dermatophagoides pteronyssinus TaxID=6956 RepID=A0ABQ8IYP1_DERPT|nr:hypothetical protein DERP_010274 [Dermatophagoides pteronyssinus]